MNRETALFVFGLSLAACSQRTTPLRDAPQVDTTASITPCKSLNDACPEAQVNCDGDGDADGSCLADKQIYFGGYCAAAQSDNPCNEDGTLTQNYRDYCEVESCLGHDKNQCLQDGTNQCKPKFCNSLDEQQTNCGTWHGRYQEVGCGYTDAQADCITETLKTLESDYHTSTCNYPTAMTANRCAGGQITNIGIAGCFIQECLGLNTAESCVATTAILCSAINP